MPLKIAFIHFCIAVRRLYQAECQRIVSKIGGGLNGRGQGPLKAGNDQIDYAAKAEVLFEEDRALRKYPVDIFSEGPACRGAKMKNS